MGTYVNPRGMTKEAWLEANAVETDWVPVWAELPPGHVPVCLVQNLHFTAAGVAHTEALLNRYSAPDSRPRRWFVVEEALLQGVTTT